jgi:hypothetical protein
MDALLAPRGGHTETMQQKVDGTHLKHACENLKKNTCKLKKKKHLKNT